MEAGITPMVAQNQVVLQGKGWYEAFLLPVFWDEREAGRTPGSGRAPGDFSTVEDDRARLDG